MKIFNGKIEEFILTTLFTKGSVSSTYLVKQLSTKASKQGVYRVLRKLVKEEKIVIYKSKVSLNDLWLFKLRNLLEARTTQTPLIENLINLSNKERMFLTVSTLTHLDQVWMSIFFSIEKNVDPSVPVYLYNHHNWSSLLRRETDELYIDVLSKKRRSTYFTVGGTTTFDKQIKKLMQADTFKYSLNPNINPKEDIAVLGDHIIRIIFSKETRELMSKAFHESADLDELERKIFEIDSVASAKLIVSKNRKLAHMWRKRIAKDYL